MSNAFYKEKQCCVFVSALFHIISPVLLLLTQLGSFDYFLLSIYLTLNCRKISNAALGSLQTYNLLTWQKATTSETSYPVHWVSKYKRNLTMHILHCLILLHLYYYCCCYCCPSASPYSGSPQKIIRFTYLIFAEVLWPFLMQPSYFIWVWDRYWKLTPQCPGIEPWLWLKHGFLPLDTSLTELNYASNLHLGLLILMKWQHMNLF